MNLPQNAQKLIALLSAAGYEAYAVGGFVRDSLMGRDAGDVDITTSAKPDEVESVLLKNGIHYAETGIKHGTITAVLGREPYEITTFRTDGDYHDNRHPDSVHFVHSLREDLARRDFTVNALAYHDTVGVIDEFGGIADMENRLIRAVGNPDKRFKEDALRIMRALRFASVLGFEIEEGTAKAIFTNKELLLNIAGERIYTELVKLLLGDNCEDILLKYREIFAVILPELVPCFDFPQHSKWHLYDVYTHIVKSVALTPKKDYMRLAMLFHDIGKPFCKTTDEKGQDHFKGHPAISVEKGASILSRLHASNEIKHKVLTLIQYHDLYITEKPSNIKKWLRTLGEALTLDYIDFKIADLASHNLSLSQPEIDTLYRIKERTVAIIDSREPYRISDLAVNGNDLKALGYDGKEIAEELEHLINEVSGNPSLNEKEKLLLLAEVDYKPFRKQNRLKGYDYSTNGAYFITICTKDKAQILSHISGNKNTVGAIHESPAKVALSQYGLIINDVIKRLNVRFNINVSNYVIMPNHVHLMIEIDNRAIRESPLQSKRSIISRVIGYLKMNSSKEAHYIDSELQLWQRSFHDHIIRNEEDYLLHLQYIDENPRKWLLGEDEYYS